MPLTKTQTPSKPVLEWLFVANFSDGTHIYQDQEDASTLKEGASQFHDVMAREDELISFGLAKGKEWVLVDVVTGNFMCNGTALQLHNQNFDPTRYKLKLVFFRQKAASQDIKATVNKDMSVSEEFVGATRDEIQLYFIGWETEVHGKHKQVTLAVG